MYCLFNRYLPTKVFLLLVPEALLLFSAAFFTGLFTGKGALNMPLGGYAPTALLLTVLYLVIFYYFDLYSSSSYKPGVKMLSRVLYAVSLSGIALFLLANLFPSLNEWGLVLLVIILPFFVPLWRAMVTWFLGGRLSENRVLIIGSGSLAKKISDEIENQPLHGLRVMGFIDDGAAPGVRVAPESVLIGGLGDIARVVKEQGIDRIIIALADRRKKLSMQTLLRLKTAGVAIEEGETFNERLTGRILLEGITPGWMVFSEGFRFLRWKVIKRLLDISIAALVLIASLPLILVAAALIKLDSKGPLIFRQERVGKDGKTFQIYKFRSMSTGAEKNTGPVWASVNDSRVTRVGRVIRKLRIDELPQLINVFKGDMSFVGPRPERPYFHDMLKEKIPYYELRTLVRPGLTGWAQIKYPYGATEQDALEKLQYDLYYIKNFSLILDLLIILWTIKVVLTGKGAR